MQANLMSSRFCCRCVRAFERDSLLIYRQSMRRVIKCEYCSQSHHSYLMNSIFLKYQIVDKLLFLSVAKSCWIVFLIIRVVVDNIVRRDISIAREQFRVVLTIWKNKIQIFALRATQLNLAKQQRVARRVVVVVVVFLVFFVSLVVLFFSRFRQIICKQFRSRACEQVNCEAKFFEIVLKMMSFFDCFLCEIDFFER